MSISLWILIRPETSGVVLSAGDQSWPEEMEEGGGKEGRKEGGKGGRGERGGEKKGGREEEKRQMRDETERERRKKEERILATRVPLYRCVWRILPTLEWPITAVTSASSCSVAMET